MTASRSRSESSSPPRGRYVFDQFAAARRYQPTLAFSPDGSQVAYSTNISGQFNLWRQSSAGGYPHQLTSFEDQTVREVAWSPDGETILLTADRDGDEFHQLYLIPARGGWPAALTDAPTVQHHLAVAPWSPDGRTIAYAANDREPADEDVVLRDLVGGEVGCPLAGGANYGAHAWSPDGKRLTAYEYRSNTDSDVHVVSLDGGSARSGTTHEGDAKF